MPEQQKKEKNYLVEKTERTLYAWSTVYAVRVGVRAH